MALTHAVAHGAAAAAAGAGKKAAQVQLQAELNTDDDFAHFLQRDGLLVVDVYTEWCGPCLGMVGNLKKIKVELGGDNMHLAVAKSDTIECLKRFRNRSEPTWMFLAGGQLLNVVFGADAPRVARTIEHELRQEELVRRGEQQRVQRAPHELTPHEQEAADAEARAEAARREREAAAAAEARMARREARARSIEPYFGDACPALLLPHAQKHLRKVTDALEPFGVVVADKCPLVVGREVVRALAVEEAELGGAGAVAALVERPSLALLFKKLPDREGDVIELSRRALFGDGPERAEGEELAKRYVGEELRAGDVPGLFVPVDRHQRAAVLDLLFPKTVSAVSPPPAAPPPPHVAVVCGAWQRRAALAAAGTQLLCYGFFADASIDQPRLLCKTLDQYEARPEKDYSETVVMMIAVGVAEPALAEPEAVPPPEPPERLLALGPLHVSADAVAGATECARYFPPGYTEPDIKPKPKSRKKKKKRHETKDLDETPEAANGTTEETDADGAGDAGGDDGEGGADDGEGGADDGEGGADEGEGGADEGEAGADDARADKATSPPPAT